MDFGSPLSLLRRSLLPALLLGLATSSMAFGQDPPADRPARPASAANSYGTVGSASDYLSDAPAAPAPCGCSCPSCKASGDKGAAKPAAGCKTCCHGHVLDWSQLPETIHPLSRAGNFSIPPAPGPGYFSLWDALSDNCRQAPPKSGYPSFTLMPPSFFDADFRYVDAMDPAETTLVEELKRLHLNDCLLLSTGGHFWLRHMHEQNSRLTEATNEYEQARVRLYGDLTYSDWLRVYGEYIWADNFGEDLAPLPVDVNRGDILNLFADVRLFDLADHGVYARGGRQELLYGSQRSISTLDWVNTRRTFEGVKVFRQGEEWDYDAFWVQPVPPNPTELDSPDDNVNFVGSWLTYRPEEGRFLDLYYLYLGNRNELLQQGIVRAPFDLHSLGTRWTGDKEGYLWDVELVGQLGDQEDQDIRAGAATAGLGRHWKDAWMSPTAWIYFDYASGDGDPNNGKYNTFHQLFPFGHYYLGWADLVGRQNIQDLNAHLYFYPAPWVTMFFQYHHFWLARSRDALYGVAGVPYRRDPTGQAGMNVGDELDCVANFHLTRYSDLLVGCAQLFGGGFLEGTSGPQQAADAQSLYLMFQQRW